MLRKSCTSLLLITATSLAVLTAPAVASHKSLNGVWNLVPTRAELAGEPMIQTGTVTINDREGNISISRSFMFDGETQTVSYTLNMDGKKNSSIHEGPNFKTKAKWEGETLVVTTTQDNARSTERYRLNDERTMTLSVDRPGHRTVTLFFERQ